MFKLDGEDFQNLSAEDRKDLFTNFAAFVFGNAVLSLERTLVNRQYDHEEFCERFNLGANSLQLDEVQVRTEKREELSPEMSSLIKEDPTFAIFFEEKGVQALPNPLRQFMETGGILRVIREAILPIYKPRVKRVVAS